MFDENRGWCGAPRVTAALRLRGRTVNHKRIQPIMRIEHLRGRMRRRFKVTTRRVDRHPVSSNVLAEIPITERLGEKL